MLRRMNSLFAMILVCLTAALVSVNCHIVTEKNFKHHPLDHFSSSANAVSRRCLFHQACRAVLSTSVAVTVASPLRVFAEDDSAAMTTVEGRGGKPYAPIEALLPATRCKVWIDRAYGISSQLSPFLDNSSDKDQKERAYRLLQELDRTLSAMPVLFGKNDRKKNTNSLGAAAGQITASVSSANKSQYKQNRENLSVPNQLQAMFNQADVERQWGMLQYAESNREKDNPVRAAFNFYTQQLTFGDSYLLTASQEDKKKMIRGQGLPSLTAVITSDLDLRDLYRNQLLTAIDDARAEVAYQVKQSPSEVDLADAVSLMNQAHVACDRWFGLIPENDLQEALKLVSSEAL